MHESDALLLGQQLYLGPPLGKLRIRDADLRPQQQEVVGGAKARMLQQAQRLDPAAAAESRLEHEQLAHGHGETPRYSHS